VQDHFSAPEQYKWRKHELITELQEFEHDTGTMPVQIGLLSERISYLTKHTLVHRKDHAGRRGLLILLSKRRKMLKYLRKKNFDTYVKVCAASTIESFIVIRWFHIHVSKGHRQDSIHDF
jgi:small subunit ribosomal protein S15